MNDRQSRAVDCLMQNDRLTIHDYEAFYPDLNRRTLQRDLKAMIDMELLVSEGSTNQLTYLMKG